MEIHYTKKPYDGEMNHEPMSCSVRGDVREKDLRSAKEGVSHQLYAVRLPLFSAICVLVLPRGWPAHRPREIAWTNVSLMAGYRRKLVRHIETGDFSCDSVSSSGRVPEICGSHGGKEVISNKGYIKASRYDIKAQWHNGRMFHRELVARPWRALGLAIGMSILGANAGFNLVEAPRWDRHPWMGWLLGGLALLVGSYFLLCAVLGWRATQASSQDSKATRP